MVLARYRLIHRHCYSLNKKLGTQANSRRGFPVVIVLGSRLTKRPSLLSKSLVRPCFPPTFPQTLIPPKITSSSERVPSTVDSETTCLQKVSLDFILDITSIDQLRRYIVKRNHPQCQLGLGPFCVQQHILTRLRRCELLNTTWTSPQYIVVCPRPFIYSTAGNISVC